MLALGILVVIRMGIGLVLTTAAAVVAGVLREHQDLSHAVPL